MDISQKMVKFYLTELNLCSNRWLRLKMSSSVAPKLKLPARKKEPSVIKNLEKRKRLNLTI